MATVSNLKIGKGRDEDSRTFTAVVNGAPIKGRLVKGWSRLGGWGWTAYIEGVTTTGGAQMSSSMRAAVEKAADWIKSSSSRARFSELDLRPTEEMASNAERGLALREEYGRGGTEVGVARARDIKNRKNLSPDTVKRMHSYFSRHEVDKKGKGWKSGSEGYPSAGLIAWLLWGGDSGKSWAERKVNAMKNENSRMSFASRGVKINSPTYEMIARAFISGSSVSEAQLKKAESVVEQLKEQASREPKNAPIFKSFASELARMIKAIRARKNTNNKSNSMKNNNKEWFAHPSWSEGMLGKETAPQLAAYSWIERNNVPVQGRTQTLLADLAAGIHANNSSLSIAQAVLAAAKDMVKKGVATGDLREWVSRGGKFARIGHKSINAANPFAAFKKAITTQLASAGLRASSVEGGAAEEYIEVLINMPSVGGYAVIVFDAVECRVVYKDSTMKKDKTIYSALVRGTKVEQVAAKAVDSIKSAAPKGKGKNSLNDACSDGYEAVGTKKKDGKTVPNCVPMARPGIRKWIAQGYSPAEAAAIAYDQARRSRI